MSRTSNSRMELLTNLYNKRGFLRIKLALQKQTFIRVGGNLKEIFKTTSDLEILEKQINNFEDI